MDRFKQAFKVSIIGIIANIFLFIIKMIVGTLSRSQAIIADALNSGSDIISSIMTYIGNKIAQEPKDKDHPYGHEKAEYIFSMLISLVMVVIAASILKSAVKSIINHEVIIFSWWIVIICIITIIVKLALFIYTKKLGEKENNLLIQANSVDHRNDMLVTTGVLIGIAFSQLGIYWVDGVVAILISIFIIFTGVKIFISAYKVLMDTEISDELKLKIEEIIEKQEQIERIDEITSSPVGVKYLIFVKVAVNGDMSVSKSHTIAHKIKDELLKIHSVADAIIHINPA